MPAFSVPRARAGRGLRRGTLLRIGRKYKPTTYKLVPVSANASIRTVKTIPTTAPVCKSSELVPGSAYPQYWQTVASIGISKWFETVLPPSLRDRIQYIVTGTACGATGSGNGCGHGCVRYFLENRWHFQFL